MRGAHATLISLCCWLAACSAVLSASLHRRLIQPSNVQGDLTNSANVVNNYCYTRKQQMPQGAENGLSMSIAFCPRVTPISVQGTAALFFQSLVKLYMNAGNSPSQAQDNYKFNQGSSGSPSFLSPQYEVELFIKSATGNDSNSTTSNNFPMTNGRIVEMISLLGFDYAERQSLRNFTEYDFIVSLTPFRGHASLLATGYIQNQRATIE